MAKTAAGAVLMLCMATTMPDVSALLALPAQGGLVAAVTTANGSAMSLLDVNSQEGSDAGAWHSQVDRLMGAVQQHPSEGLQLLQKVFQAQREMLTETASAETSKKAVRSAAAAFLQKSGLEDPSSDRTCVSDPVYAPYGCPVDPLLDIDLVWDANNYLEKFMIVSNGTALQLEHYNMSSNASWDLREFPLEIVSRDWRGAGPHYVDMPWYIRDKYLHTTTTTTVTDKDRVHMAHTYAAGFIETEVKKQELSRETLLGQVDGLAYVVAAMLETDRK